MEFYNWMQNDTNENSAHMKDHKGCDPDPKKNPLNQQQPTE